MEQNMELPDIISEEIERLKIKLNKLYDEKYQISAEMLEVSMQLDKKINRYMRMKRKRICSDKNK